MSDNAVTRRLRRVFSMSGDEFVTRSRQEIGKRVDGLLARVGHNFPETPQASTSTPKFFFNTQDVPAIFAALKERLPDQYKSIVPRAEKICAHRFDLLGYRGLDYGKNIDWSLDRVHGKRAPKKLFYNIRYLDFGECGDAKVTWELNRHQHFVTLAKAYRITGEQRFADEIFAQWEHWHRDNPYPYGVNWASSLEFAFRSLSWLWTYYLLGDALDQRLEFRDQFLRLISVHGRAIERYLSTYFSPNTHLLGEAVALFFIGMLCPELPSAERWKKLGWRITLQEAQRQVRGDGLHFEQSLYYHVYAIDFFLHARILAARNGLAIPSDYDATVERMLNALAVLGRTGHVPRIGDDDGGRLFDGQRNRTEHMLDPLATGAIIYQRGDFKFLAHGLREETLWLLGTEGLRAFDKVPESQPDNKSIALRESGLYVVNDPESQIIIDAGPLGAGSGGHGHADALSICVSNENGPVLIDSGTFEYVGDGADRSGYRGTSAHNTITVDGRSQPEPRGPFAWSHHPKSVAEKWINGDQFNFFAGNQDAYTKLSPPVLHRRFVFSLKQSFWLVRDLIDGSGERKLESYWHLAPEFTASSGGRFVHPGGSALDLMTPGGSTWSSQIEAGAWSPAYGESQPAPVLHFSTVASLPTEFVTLFRSRQDATVPTGSFRAIGKNAAVSGYAYLDGDEQHRMFFADSGKPWILEHFSSDAEFLYWQHDQKRDRVMLIVCGGSSVSFAGREVVTSPMRVSYYEVLWENGSVKLSGPGSEAVSVREVWRGEPTLASARQSVNG